MGAQDDENRIQGVKIPGTVNSVEGDIVGGNKTVIYQPEVKDEKRIVRELLIFLEDKRLVTEPFGYQSHFPDPLRRSAGHIRTESTEALRNLPEDSPIAPPLRRLRTAARNFQEATEGAMDGHRAGVGMTPFLPMKLSDYLGSLLDYRREIVRSICDAAAQVGLDVPDEIQRHADEDPVDAVHLIEGLRQEGR